MRSVEADDPTSTMPSTSAHIDDRAGKEYWDAAWEDEQTSPEIDPRSSSIWAHRDQLFHRAFKRLIDTQSPAILELGCARSCWLPYFAKEFGARVAGLDYSAIGAAQADATLHRAGVDGEVRCADLFDPPADWRNAFDVVVWFGVAEHFNDATGAIRAASAFLKPGGLLITEIPNMVGAIGLLQRWFNKPVYDIHVPHSRESLSRHHEQAGLDVVFAEYILPTDFGVVEMKGVPEGVVRSVQERVLYLLRLLTGCVWWLDRRLNLPAPRWTSGFVLVAARLPPK
jgi:2-polyprenyl-3-methyl-5-hydroxy-6-metoxy-1,4-benzoquinol methylase